MENNKQIKILFIGDIFGEQSVKELEKNLSSIVGENGIDFVIAQGENISERKGLVPDDYHRLVKAGINAFTMGNHIWSKRKISHIINEDKIIRPYNVNASYPGKGSRVYNIKGMTLRVTSMLGITFNELRDGWNEEKANDFFDAYDQLEQTEDKTDFHIIDFHAETTSEKAVFSLYVDGKVDAVIGTHTHVQTNDERILPKGTAFITDVGMTGPVDAAIGCTFDTVYRKMRFDEMIKFEVATSKIELNCVILTIKMDKKHQITKKKHFF